MHSVEEGGPEQVGFDQVMMGKQSALAKLTRAKATTDAKIIKYFISTPRNFKRERQVSMLISGPGNGYLLGESPLNINIR